MRGRRGRRRSFRSPRRRVFGGRRRSGSFRGRRRGSAGRLRIGFRM